MEILYVKAVDRKITFCTDSVCYEGSLIDQLDLILSRYGFALLNQNTIVNLKQIKSYDSKLGIVYFNDEKTDSCQVSRRNKHKVPSKFDNFLQE